MVVQLHVWVVVEPVPSMVQHQHAARHINQVPAARALLTQEVERLHQGHKLTAGSTKMGFWYLQYGGVVTG